MAIAIHAKRGLTRRQLLTRSASTAALAAIGGLARPYLSRAADRPQVTCGLQSGDVSAGSALVWARADRAARMQVECSTVESFATIVRSSSIDALPDHDFAAKLLLEGLPPGQEIFYRVRFDDIGESGISGETQIGHFRTAPVERRSISFTWSGDTAGQGWGIDASRGGMRSYKTMLDNRPDFFIHSGDSIYADCPVPAELKLPDGGVWRNIVTEEKSTVASSLAEFRGNYEYNLLDETFARSTRKCPSLRSGTTMR
jgi:alkaline phosphatase D